MKEQPRCVCGTCSMCLDNARWERIFNEKFAWPDYYKDASAPPHIRSSFSDFAVAVRALYSRD